MKIIKLISALAVVSMIVVIVGACTKDKSLPETNQENDFSESQNDINLSLENEQDEMEKEDEQILQDDESVSPETPVTKADNETSETNETDKSQDKQQNNGILGNADAKKVIEATAEQVITAISEKDVATISEFVHPEKGLRFTPYTFVSLESDIVYTKEEVKNFFDDSNEYLWGYYDGSGEDIRLTPSEYYSSFIYTEDFKNAPQVGYNEVLRFGNMQENQFEVYESPIVVEYYFPGFDPDFEGLDWKSLRLVFEEYEDNWKLVGIIHNQWTI